MKRSLVFIMAGTFLFMASCSSSNNQTIGKNVDPDVTNLRNDKTYSWITDIDKIPDARAFISESGVYFYNNESTRKRIKEAIEYELDARGYKMRNKNDKGMLISFLVLERADTLRTTGGYFTLYGEPVISSDDIKYEPVLPGTLIVSIVDKETDKMVWQGFASGVLKPEDINDEAKIRQAVSGIFSKFNYDALNS